MIGFNKPYIIGKESEYIQAAIKLEKLSATDISLKAVRSFSKNDMVLRKPC